MRDKSDLRSYQLSLIKEIKDRSRVLLAVDMGLGKTISCLTSIEESPDLKKILIVGPKNVAQATWPDEFKEWEHTKDITFTLIKGTEKQRLKCLNEDTRCYIVNKELMPWLFLNSKINFDMIIWDESSSLKSAKLKTAKGEMTRYSALLKMSEKVKKLVLLTGTPTPNGLEDIFGQIRVLDENALGKSKYKFLEKYFINKSRDPNYPIWVARGGSYNIVMEKVNHLVIKMKSDDYITLPDFLPINKYVEMDEKTKELYNRLENHFLLKDEEIVASNPAVLINKLLQLNTGSVYKEDGSYKTFHTLKIDALKEIIEDDENINENFLVFYNYQHEKEQLEKHFKDIVFLKGKDDIANWNDGKIKIFACHPASAGHGLNLQKGGNIIIWTSMPWSLELYQQANKRLHRSGQQNAVRCFHIITKNTVDEYVLKVLQNKDATQEMIFKLIKGI